MLHKWFVTLILSPTLMSVLTSLLNTSPRTDLMFDSVPTLEYIERVEYTGSYAASFENLIMGVSWSTLGMLLLPSTQLTSDTIYIPIGI